MARRSVTIRKKKRRAPAAGEGPLISLRLEPGALARVDRWAASQKDHPSRPEAVRRLVELGLGIAQRAAFDLHLRATALEELLLNCSCNRTLQSAALMRTQTPWIGANCRNPAFPLRIVGKRGVEHRFRLRAPRVFTRPVRDVDQSRANGA